MIAIESRKFEIEHGRDDTIVEVDGLVSPPITLTYVPYGSGKVRQVSTLLALCHDAVFVRPGLLRLNEDDRRLHCMNMGLRILWHIYK